jgi:HTH-type transcriptional regulator/antitoxin HipB
MRINSVKELAVFTQNQRLEKKFSQEEVADLAAIRQATVSAFETDPSSAKIETLFKLLSALDLELEVRPKNPTVGSIKLDW